MIKLFNAFKYKEDTSIRKIVKIVEHKNLTKKNFIFLILFIFSILFFLGAILFFIKNKAANKHKDNNRMNVPETSVANNQIVIKKLVESIIAYNKDCLKIAKIYEKMGEEIPIIRERLFKYLDSIELAENLKQEYDLFFSIGQGWKYWNSLEEKKFKFLLRLYKNDIIEYFLKIVSSSQNYNLIHEFTDEEINKLTNSFYEANFNLREYFEKFKSDSWIVSRKIEFLESFLSRESFCENFKYLENIMRHGIFKRTSRLLNESNNNEYKCGKRQLEYKEDLLFLLELSKLYKETTEKDKHELNSFIKSIRDSSEEYYFCDYKNYTEFPDFIPKNG